MKGCEDLVALYIILGIVLLLAVILTLYIQLIFEYNGEIARFFLKIGPVKITLSPKKRKKLRYKKLSRKLKHQKLSEIKPKKPGEKKVASKKGTFDDISLEGLIKSISENSNNPELVRIFLNAIKEFVFKFRHKLHSRVESFRITVDENDASKTCITVGIIGQSVAYFMEFLNVNTVLEPPTEGAVAVIPCFDDSGYKFDIRGKFKVRIINILAALISAAFKSMTSDINENKKVQTRKDIKQ